MITMDLELELQPEITSGHSHRSEYSTCYECHRTFRAASNSDFHPELCDSCIDIMRHLGEPVISVRPEAQSEHRFWL